MKNISFFLNNKLGGDFITFHYRYRKQIIIVILSIIIIIPVISYLIISYKPKEKDIVEDKIVNSNKIEKNDTSKDNVYVDIKGEVNSPGIYLMNNNSRVIDVIDKAGGLTSNANTTVINLSKKVQDEMVIIIYSNEQVNNFYETKKIEEQVLDKCLQPETDSLKNDACICSNDNIQSNKININTATKEVLMTLPGIGESKAKDIIAYRESNGSFSSIEDIKKVNGIGDSLYTKIKEIITV